MKILPFRGYRYNPEIVGRLDDVISPPYDQFKEGLDDLLFARHPHNMAHLIVNKETAADTETDNRYTRSRGLLDSWLRKGVFGQDSQPSLYPYFQTYETGGSSKTRKGFIALGEVTEYAQKIVLPHERTLSKPKQDRLNLLRSTLADTGLVFMLYSDPASEIEDLIASVTAGVADMRALDLKGEENQLWKASDPVLDRAHHRFDGRQAGDHCRWTPPLRSGTTLQSGNREQGRCERMLGLVSLQADEFCPAGVGRYHNFSHSPLASQSQGIRCRSVSAADERALRR